jgi:hypothetical protein
VEGIRVPARRANFFSNPNGVAKKTRRVALNLAELGANCCLIAASSGVLHGFSGKPAR